MRLTVFFLLLVTYLSQVQAQVPTGFVQRQVASNLNPTALVFSPDGQLFVVEKDGIVREIADDVLTPDPFLTIASVDVTNERGLSGFCFHPDFPAVPYCYTYYTVKDRNVNRLSRFSVSNGLAKPETELILMEFDPLLGSIHNSGALRFGLDKKLYVAVGDGASPGAAQQFDSLLGKLLRLNEDGSIPTDNPFFAQLSGRFRAIYALGLRNPFSMDIHPVSGKLLVGDVGQESYEEINEIKPGSNYGWPIIEGRRTTQAAPVNYQDPLFAYGHTPGCAVTGVAFYTPKTPRFPVNYVDKFFFADYCGGTIQLLNHATGQLLGTFVTGIDRPVAMAVSPDGYLYYAARAGMGGGSQQDNTATWNGTINKVSYFDSGVPYITRQSANKLVPVGETVVFTVDAVGQKPLVYSWYRAGKLLAETSQNSFTLASPTLADNGAEFSCLVSNPLGSSASRPMGLRVVEGQRPVASIMLPKTVTTYRGGTTLTFSGVALNKAGQPMPGATLTWWINFHHDEHTHPAMSAIRGVAAGEYLVPRVGETATNVWYRIHLMATGPSGLTAESYVDVKPQLTTVAVESTPADAGLTLDGVPRQAGFVFQAVAGTQRILHVKPYLTSEAGMFRFTGWGGTQAGNQLLYNVPDTDATVKLVYENLPAPGGQGLWAEYFTKTADFAGAPTLVRIDPQVDFNWGNTSPLRTISSDDFVVRWTGKIQVPFADSYTFFTQSDDGVRLWVDNKLLIDKWAPQPELEWQGRINLLAGKPYTIRLEYQELQGEAVMRLRWAGSQFGKGPIPTGYMSTANIITATKPVTQTRLEVYPVPARQQATLRYTTERPGPARLVLTDLLGRQLHEQWIDLIAGVNTIPVSLSGIGAGMYLVSIAEANQVVVRVRLVVN